MSMNWVKVKSVSHILVFVLPLLIQRCCLDFCIGYKCWVGFSLVACGLLFPSRILWCHVLCPFSLYIVWLLVFRFGHGGGGFYWFFFFFFFFWVGKDHLDVLVGQHFKTENNGERKTDHLGYTLMFTNTVNFEWFISKLLLYKQKFWKWLLQF